ncbi:hypothetical protein TNCV_2818831 [Trichonephila clavipes]|nr:hypothetical protein TNCV_2818831 [Trichonephila clavipes]
MQRDLFGRLLGISMTNKVDIEKVLGFPLTPIPTSMCHADGSICKTDKAQLIKVLEKKTSGWIVNDDKYDFVWFAGEQFPSSVAGIVIKKPTLLEIQNTKQDDDYDDVDNNESSDNDDDYEDASVFCDTFTK